MYIKMIIDKWHDDAIVGLRVYNNNGECVSLYKKAGLDIIGEESEERFEYPDPDDCLAAADRIARQTGLVRDE